MNIRRFFVALAVSCAFLHSWSVPALTQTTVTATAPSGDDAIQKAIHDYILAHPEVLIQFLRIAK